MDILKWTLALGDYRLGVSFLMAWFCLTALNPDTAPPEILRLRDRGADRQIEIINTYHRQGIRDDILLIILYQKLRFIAVAETKRQVQEIIKPSTPRYVAGEISINSPYHVEEEEMVLWSLVSAQYVLHYKAKIRALSLFDRFQKKWGSSCPESLGVSSTETGQGHEAAREIEQTRLERSSMDKTKMEAERQIAGVSANQHC